MGCCHLCSHTGLCAWKGPMLALMLCCHQSLNKGPRIFISHRAMQIMVVTEGEKAK